MEKTEIVKRLLAENKISFEEALTLAYEDRQQPVYIPYLPYPYYPPLTYPAYPYPFTIFCGTTSGATVNQTLTFHDPFPAGDYAAMLNPNFESWATKY